MTLDYTKTATPCELIRALIPLTSGNLWSHDGRRWHARNPHGSWSAGHQRFRHLRLIHDVARQLPAGEHWERYRSLLARPHWQYQALRELMVARGVGLIARPDDYPLPDAWPVGELTSCICYQGCWDDLPRPGLAGDHFRKQGTWPAPTAAFKAVAASDFTTSLDQGLPAASEPALDLPAPPESKIQRLLRISREKQAS